jgi:signal-transduction protein with cAMP-binding, CBS, and nucleotidyltransferase domain
MDLNLITEDHSGCASPAGTAQCHDEYGDNDIEYMQPVVAAAAQCHDEYESSSLGMVATEAARAAARQAAKGSGILATGQTRLGALAFRPLVRVSAGTSLAETARRLRTADVSSALVDEAGLVIVTERDLTAALARGLSPRTLVGEIAHTTPIWVTTTSTVSEAAAMMLHHEVRHIIVILPEGTPIGIVSMRDIFSVLLREVGQLQGLVREASQ